MDSAVHIKTKVLPGKKIELTSPSLVEGEQVEVIIVLPAKPRGRRRYVLDTLKAPPPPKLFGTPEEADQYLKEERNSWDAGETA